MPINPNIALQVRPLELQDPLAAYGRVAAIQQAQNQNALAQYQLGKAQREDEQSRALNALYAGAVTPEGNVDYNKLIAGAGQQGMGSLVPGILKGQREAAEAQAKADKEFGAAVEQRMKASRQLLEGVSTPEQYIAWHEANHKDPVLSKFFAQRGITAADARGRIQDAINAGPEAFNKLLTESKIGAEKAAEQIAAANKPMSVAAGASVYDPVKGTFTQAPAAPVKPTPAETEEIVLRLQDPTLSPQLRKSLEARLAILTTREPKEPKADETKVIAQTVYDQAGNPTFLNKFGQVITPTTATGAAAVVKGKPTATFEKTTAQRKQLSVDLDRAITELSAATKPGGLIDQSTGSGFGRLVDVGAGFVGQATPGAIATGKLAPLADMVLKMVPRFEGPQSDKDTRSYKEAAGQLADSTLPNEIRKQAGLEILRLMKDRKGQFATQEMAAEGAGGTAPAAAPAASKSGATVSNW